MKYLCKYFLAISLLSAAMNAAAETKIGYVQIDRIMQSPPSLDIGKKLQNEFTPRNAELERLKKQIEDKQTALDKDVNKLSDTESREKSKQLSDIKIEFERMQREITEDFNQRKSEELSSLQDRINKAVTNVSQTEGYDLVLYNGIAYAGKKIDITDKIISALGKN